MVLFKVVFGYISCRQSLPSSPPERLNTAQPGHELEAHSDIGKDQCNQNQLNSFNFLNNDGLLSGISLSSDVCSEISKLNSTLLDSTMVGFLQSAQQCLHFLVFALFGLIGEPLIGEPS